MFLAIGNPFYSYHGQYKTDLSWTSVLGWLNDVVSREMAMV
jgi:hypothetical protein